MFIIIKGCACRVKINNFLFLPIQSETSFSAFKFIYVPWDGDGESTDIMRNFHLAFFLYRQFCVFFSHNNIIITSLQICFLNQEKKKRQKSECEISFMFSLNNFVEQINPLCVISSIRFAFQQSYMLFTYGKCMIKSLNLLRFLFRIIAQRSVLNLVLRLA